MQLGSSTLVGDVVEDVYGGSGALIGEGAVRGPCVGRPYDGEAGTPDLWLGDMV